jgi:hypothetical protein
MAIIAKFAVDGMSSSKYEQILSTLDDMGLGAPPGRLYHVCYGSSDNLQVIDVFASIEDLQRFGDALMPILQDVGVTAAPEPADVYNIIAGA